MSVYWGDVPCEGHQGYISPSWVVVCARDERISWAHGPPGDGGGSPLEKGETADSRGARFRVVPEWFHLVFVGFASQFPSWFLDCVMHGSGLVPT